MRRLLRTVGLALAVLAGTSLTFLLVLDNVIMPRIVEVPMVTVPDVRGSSAAEAHRRVASKGLRLAVRDSVFSESATVGEIVDQLPRPGERIKRARRVFVDLSRGRRLYTVPDVTRVSQREAGLKIQSHQLQAGAVDYASSTAIPEGVVIRQHPAAGERVARGSSVRLVISSGSPFTPKPVPDLIGLPIDAVEDSLRKYEMSLGTVRERVAELLPPGQVLAQNPEGGVLATRGTAVEVVVSVRRTPTGETSR
jgi:serine/threonine-protein kinase